MGLEEVLFSCVTLDLFPEQMIAHLHDSLHVLSRSFSWGVRKTEYWRKGDNETTVFWNVVRVDGVCSNDLACSCYPRAEKCILRKL